MMKLLAIFVCLLATVSSIDLCVFFNNCGQNGRRPHRPVVIDLSPFIQIHNPNNKRPQTIRPQPEPKGGPPVNDRWFPRPGAGNNDFLYHFAPSGQMDWFQAEEYCEKQGGYLVEIENQQDQDFLRQEGARRPNVNWWIGLREAEDCQCSRQGNSFRASLDYSSLQDRTEAYLKTKCPNEFAKICQKPKWRWIGSGLKVGDFSKWSPGQPEDNSEHCAVLWSEGDYKWGDWSCHTIMAGNGRFSFRPICQKDNEDIDDYDEEDGDYYNEDGKEDSTSKSEAIHLPCIDADFKYSFERNQRIEKVKGVGNYQECQRLCALEPECKHWVWRGDKRKKKCSLVGELRAQNYKEPLQGAYSGRMDKECSSGLNLNEVYGSKPSGRQANSFCVEYGAIYRGLVTMRFVNKIPTPELCKLLCKSNNGCTFWTWRGETPQQRCILKASGDYKRVKKVGTVSGSVIGQCANTPIDQMKDCNCVGKKQNSNNGDLFQDDIDNDDTEDYEDEYQDLDLTGLIDLRIKDPTDFNLALCQPSEIRQCKIGQPNNNSNNNNNNNINKNNDRNRNRNKNNRNRNRNNKNRNRNNNNNKNDNKNEKDVCVDYNFQYNDGGNLQSFNNIQTAVECRNLCLGNERCNSFVWKGNIARKRCHLKEFIDGNSVGIVRQGTVSGSVQGECRNLQLSQLTKCICVNPNISVSSVNGGDDDEYSDDYQDLTGLIDLRLSNPAGVNGAKPCQADESLRCYASDPATNIGINSRSNFGAASESDTGDDSAVIFG